jgi:acetyl-CoA acetyltransferase/uncharacterized OB-fold protein
MAGGTVPVPTPETGPFWAGTLAGELRVQRCGRCGRHYFYPRPFCRYCQSADVTWQVVSGGGRLVSYVINYRPLPPADPAEPQVIALVELDEGPRMLTNIVGVPPEPGQLPLDARVQVEFQPRGDQALPVFRLTGAPAPAPAATSLPAEASRPVPPAAPRPSRGQPAGMHGGNVAIIGASETRDVGVLPDRSVIQLHAEAALAALVDAGLTAADVDGVATAGPLPLEVSHHLGITPRWLDGTMVGGCSFMLHVRHAAAAIAAGAASVVLVTHGESGRSRVGAGGYRANPASAQGQFEAPFGALAPYATFTVPALRFLRERGMSRRDLAEVVVAQREWAAGNPRALRRTLVTADQVLAGVPIAYPFTRDMCCVVTDGGGALVLTSAERAADLPSGRPAVYLLGSGEASEAPLMSQMDDVGSFGAFRRASAEAFATAGVGHADIGHFMGYDAFAHLPLYMLEDVGFVGRGESGAFIAEGHTRKGGRLPMNTNGGGLSYTHTGMYGMFAIQEAVRQLRGQAAVPVPGLTISFVQGVGMYFGAAGSLVLSNRRP